MTRLTEKLSKYFPSSSGPATGTYALVLLLARSRMIKIGKLGSFIFPSGHYAYIGSAFGSGGLYARIKRHMRKEKRFHWHIDYLRQHAVIEEIWICREKTKSEHAWARFLENHIGTELPIHGFGCSDCTCTTHLFHFDSRPSFHKFATSTRNVFPASASLLRIQL